MTWSPWFIKRPPHIRMFYNCGVITAARLKVVTDHVPLSLLSAFSTILRWTIVFDVTEGSKIRYINVVESKWAKYSCAHKFTDFGRIYEFLAIFSENIISDTKTFLSLMVSSWVKPFMIKHLCLLFINHHDNRNNTNDLVTHFGLITRSQAGTNRFEWLLKVTVRESVYEGPVRFWFWQTRALTSLSHGKSKRTVKRSAGKGHWTV